MSFQRAREFQLLFAALALTIALLVVPPTEPAFAQGVLVTDAITSPSLEGNLLGDPATRNITIYLPPGYDTSGQRYPAIYLMPGFGAGDRWWAYGEFPEFFTLVGIALQNLPEAGFASMIDDLIAAGEIQPMIIVMPDISTIYGGSFCVNSELNGNHEDYIINDIVPYIDANYRTLPSRDSRGIGGHCMGGYGAIYLGMRHPDVFGAVASHSGTLMTAGLLPGMQPIIAAENPEGLTMEDPDPAKPWTFSLYMFSAAFSPNADNPPFYVDLTFDENVQIVEEVAQRWAAYDLLQIFPDHVSALASLRGIYLDAGDKDEIGEQLIAQAFSEALSAAGIDHKLEIFDGMHMDKMYTRLAVSLRFLSDILVGDTEPNKAISRRDFEEAINLGRLEVYNEIIAPEAILHTVSGDIIGIEGIKGFTAMYLAAFPDLHFTVDDQVAEGDMVATRWTDTGTHQGELMGIPATGISTVGTGMSIHRTSGGQIQEAWLFSDDLGIMQQLGVMPPMPGGPPAMQRAAPEDFVWSAPSDITGDPGDPEANKGIVRREFDAWNQGDLNELMTVLDEIYSNDYVHHSPTHPHVTDFESYKRWAFEEVFPAFPDLYIPVEEVIAEGDKVLVRFGFAGTHIGFGKQVTQTGTAIYRIADGKIVEQWYACDMLTVIQQMGAMAELEANKAVVARSVEDLYNQGNLDVADEVMTVDCIQHEPDGSVTVGIENIKQAMMGLINGFPDLQLVIEDLIAEGDRVVGRFTNYFGTHQGEFAGMPPTGNEVTFISIATFRLVDGKIAEVWQRPDLMGIMEQLGVMPPTRENYEWGVPSQVTGAPGDPETNKATVQNMFNEIFGNKNLAAIDEVVADEFIMHDPTSPMEIRGPEGYKQYNSMFITGSPDIQVMIDDAVAEGDKVALRWSASGTQTGEFMSIPPTGRPITATGISIFRLADSKIVEIWVSYDALGMMQQLTMSQEEYNKAIALRVVEMWNTGDVSMADELFAADFVNHDPNRPEVIDLESYKGWLVENHTAFPDFHIELHDTIAEGDKVAARWTMTGTHKGELMGIPPTCNQITATGINIHRLADGKVVEAWWSYDALGMMQQGGVIPPIPDAPMPFLSRSGGSENFVWGKPSAVTGDPGDPEANRELVIRSVEEIWNIDSADMSQEVMDEIFSSQFINHDPLYSPIVMDAESFKQWIFDHRGDSGPAGIVVDDMIIEGDMIAYSSTVVPINLSGMTICRFADGKMVEQWWSKDVLPALVAMGMLPPMPEPTPEGYDNVFFMSLSPGLNMISLPLKPIEPYTARSFAEEINATTVIRYDTTLGKFVGFVPGAPGDGFAIEGGEGYIVNVPGGGTVVFTGAAWTNEPPVAAAPPAQTSDAWAFVVSGSVLDGGGMSARDGGYTVTVKSLRTGEVLTEAVDATGYFAAASADLSRRAIISAGDKVEVAVTDGSGEIVSGPFVHDVKLDEIRNAVANLHLKLGEIIPEKTELLQNYPNPFNPETWIPYHLHDAEAVTIRIYAATGQLIRTLDLGYRDAGIYASRSKAAYWDGKNDSGEEVASGIYFYSIAAGDFSATRKMIVTK